MTTITPLVTPQQQMAFAWRDFPLPEGRVVHVDRGVSFVKVWTIRADGQWAEAIGRDANVAVQNLATELMRKPGKLDA